MLKNILVVDDNQPFLNLIKKIFEKYSAKYTLVTTTSGSKALELLNNHYFSVVMTDLQMPNMDGYTLLEKIKKSYPDIPVIVITAFDKPKTNIVVKKTGASAYFTKPLVIDDLIVCIENLIKKETEGGILNNASIEMFIQLIEMESKTCTIRIVNEKTQERGVIFFQGGELHGARFLNINGKEAAYKLLSWEKVNISIENNCSLEQKEINEDLQAILLDALRLKDEAGKTETDFDEAQESHTAELHESNNTLINWEDSNISKNNDSKTPNSPDDELYSKIINDKSFKSVKINNEWNKYNAQVSLLGFFFNSGKYKGSYFNKLNSDNLIVIPIDNDKSYEIIIDLKSSPEKIINSLNI